ncbi:hypothetical protein Rhal01_00645 [Rubritalea halochordaticola]|uniref:PEP-CTERM protein-sorting domain-containing protein n=2 Tax=Rubritalea halochordaticola TaxID=714537 RepID=A0ABP9UXT1_9BACT
MAGVWSIHLIFGYGMRYMLSRGFVSNVKKNDSSVPVTEMGGEAYHVMGQYHSVSIEKPLNNSITQLMKNTLMFGVVSALLFTHASAATITLDTLTDSITVGSTDTTGGSTAPTAPGDSWYTGDYEGSVRTRSDGNQVELRTQWYFRFDTSALAGVDAADIVSVTMYIPQVGRLNNRTDNIALKLYDVGSNWDDDGSAYPLWNQGRPSSEIAHGTGAELGVIDNHYNVFGNTTDTSNPDVEGIFEYSSAPLQAYVESWQNGDDNDGFLLTAPNVGLTGLAFATPTLVIETAAVPEPSSVFLSISGLGFLLLRRRR